MQAKRSSGKREEEGGMNNGGGGGGTRETDKQKKIPGSLDLSPLWLK